MKTLILLAVIVLPTISNASFMDGLVGSYKVSGKACKLNEVTKLTENADIIPTSTGVQVKFKAVVGYMTLEIPFTFRFGSGKSKEKVHSDYIFRSSETFVQEWPPMSG